MSRSAHTMLLGLVSVLTVIGIVELRRSSTSGWHHIKVGLDCKAKSFGEKPVGSEFSIPFLLTNYGQSTVEIIGSEDICTRMGCVKAEGMPFEIHPYQSHWLKIIIYPRRPGILAASIDIYVHSKDVSNLTKFSVRVSGCLVTSSRESSHPVNTIEVRH